MMKPLPSDFSPRRILVVQLRQIGDVLLCTPALRALKKRFPEARLSFLAEPLPAQVLAGNPHLDEIIIREPKATGLAPLRAILEVRKKKFDLVIDFLQNPRTTLITWFSGAKVTISYANRRRHWFYTHPVAPQGKFAAEEKLSLLAILGVGPESAEMEMMVPESARQKIEEWWSSEKLGEAKRPVVCMEPFQKWLALTYPKEHWGRVGELMRERWGATVIVCWGPGRESEARWIQENSGAGVILAPHTDLHELAALDRKADLWVGVDGGPRHLAAAQGLPTFAVLGPSDDAWTPPGPRHRSVGKDGLACRPCNKRVCPEDLACMKEFSPEEVFAKLDEFWRRLPKP